MGEVENAYAIAGQLDTLPSSYLGLPLVVKYREKSIWEPGVERFEKRLFVGKPNTSLKEEDRFLLRASSNLFSFYFPIPSFVANKLEAIQRRFLWGSFGDDFKYHLVKWAILN